jgi:predicted DNA-binding transcriptional regulator YafY
MEQTLHLGMKPYKQCSKFKEIINRVNDAATNKRSIEMVYYTMSREKESKRKVDPYKIWFFNGTFYLIGRCHVRDEVRIFALDRIKMLHQTKDTFEVHEDFSFEEFIGPSFGVFQGEPIHIKVWFSPDVAGYIKEKIWHESQKIHQQDDGSIIFQSAIDDSRNMTTRALLIIRSCSTWASETQGATCLHATISAFGITNHPQH